MSTVDFQQLEVIAVDINVVLRQYDSVIGSMDRDEYARNKETYHDVRQCLQEASNSLTELIY